MRERRLIAELLAPLATHPAARGLTDDAAVWMPPLGRELVFTKDLLAEGVHFLSTDPPGDVAWKALAVNLSDLAAMGATPHAVLLGLAMPAPTSPRSASVHDQSAAETANSAGFHHTPEQFLRNFTAGLDVALAHWNVALLGGDTISLATSNSADFSAITLSITAIGAIERKTALARSGGHPGDDLYVSGTIGDAGLGLAIARGDAPPDGFLLHRYRKPTPRLELGDALRGVASACMDVSDGLLIDAERLAAASGAGAEIALAAVPLSAAALARTPDDAARIGRLTAGDDYELLFAAPAANAEAVRAASRRSRTLVTRIGRLVEGDGVRLLSNSGEDVTPARLGWEH